jgi:L-seryl-tRNA(Ser) seleniumtransferase
VLSGEAETIAARLREGELPIVGRVANERVWLDLRSVPPELDDTLALALERALAA